MITMRLFSQLTDVRQDCVLCDATTRTVVCQDCDDGLTRSALTCPVCAAPVSNALSASICGACLREPPAFDAAVAAFQYAFPLNRLIQSYKFNANLALVDFFADALAEKIVASAAFVKPDLLVALPLASGRLASRGFNQSALIAAKLSRIMHIPVAHTAMLRIRETPPQTGLSRDQRRKNIKGAFDARDDLVGKRVAIIDDVLTTGATLSEAARALKKAGAIHVDAWVVARAMFGKDDVA
jgi:ComF family protein